MKFSGVGLSWPSTGTGSTIFVNLISCKRTLRHRSALKKNRFVVH